MRATEYYISTHPRSSDLMRLFFEAGCHNICGGTSGKHETENVYVLGGWLFDWTCLSHFATTVGVGF